MKTVFNKDWIKTFELKDLGDRTLFVKSFIAMKKDDLTISIAFDLNSKEIFILDVSYPTKKDEMR